MRTLNYDFSNFERIMFQLKNDQSGSKLRELKDELNRFFKDSKCKDVLYTENTDKVFFGMCVMPIIDGDTTVRLLISNTKYRVNAYYLEIDSKLLSPMLGLTAKELVAVVLHEVGHMVNNSEPMDVVRSAIDVHLSDTNSSLVITDSVQYREILAFAVKDSLRKMTSLFAMKRKNEELIADEFVVRCGYGPSLESAFKTIVKSGAKLNQDVTNKLIVLQWTLKLYTDIKLRRIGALHSLNRGADLTASTLEGREIKWVMRKLREINDDDIIKENAIDDIVRKTSDFYKTFKYKGIRSIEDDLYELNMRVKNTGDEAEALQILRQISIRISIIDDFIRSEKLSDSERTKYYDLIDKYESLRTELSKKNTAKERYLGLFVSSPVIKNKYDQ